MGAPRRASHQHSRGRVPGRRRGPRLGRGEGLADGQEAEGNGGGGSGGSEVSWTSSQHRKLKCILQMLVTEMFLPLEMITL